MLMTVNMEHDNHFRWKVILSIYHIESSNVEEAIDYIFISACALVMFNVLFQSSIRLQRMS